MLFLKTNHMTDEELDNFLLTGEKPNWFRSRARHFQKSLKSTTHVGSKLARRTIVAFCNSPRVTRDAARKAVAKAINAMKHMVRGATKTVKALGFALGRLADGIGWFLENLPMIIWKTICVVAILAIAVGIVAFAVASPIVFLALLFAIPLALAIVFGVIELIEVFS